MTTPVSPILGVDFTSTPTSAEFALGTRVTGSDGTEWVYVQASGAITQYYAVAIDENFQAAHLTTALNTTGHVLGFAQSAFADNDYGWIAVQGSNIYGKVAASCAADARLYTTTTAGVLDDASASAAARVYGVVAVTAGSAGGATTVEIIANNARVGGDEAVS